MLPALANMFTPGQHNGICYRAGFPLMQHPDVLLDEIGVASAWEVNTLGQHEEVCYKANHPFIQHPHVCLSMEVRCCGHGQLRRHIHCYIGRSVDSRATQRSLLQGGLTTGWVTLSFSIHIFCLRTEVLPELANVKSYPLSLYGMDAKLSQTSDPASLCAFAAPMILCTRNTYILSHTYIIGKHECIIVFSDLAF